MGPQHSAHSTITQAPSATARVPWVITNAPPGFSTAHALPGSANCPRPGNRALSPVARTRNESRESNTRQEQVFGGCEHTLAPAAGDKTSLMDASDSAA